MDYFWSFMLRFFPTIVILAVIGILGVCVVQIAAFVYLMKRKDKWVGEKKHVDSVQAMKDIFGGDPVEQVNLSKYLKVIYSPRHLESGVLAKVTDLDGETHFMGSPILLVQCDEEKPIDMSEEALEEIKGHIDFY